MAMAFQASATVTASYGNQFVDYSGGQNLIYTSDNTDSVEVCLPVAPVSFYDDFLGGAITFIVSSSECTTTWAKYISGYSSATPTVAYADDGTNGYAELALTADQNIEQADLYWKDCQPFYAGQGLVWQARVKLAVLPTTTVEVYAGLAGAISTAGSAYRINFKLIGTTGGLIKASTDDNSTDSGLVTTGVTVVANQWVILTIDASKAADIKFYINGNRVASGTTFAYDATASNLQPYFAVIKTTLGNVGIATLDVDYCRVWQNRK